MTAPHLSTVILPSAHLLGPAGEHPPSLLAHIDRHIYDGWGEDSHKPHSFKRAWLHLHLQHYQWALSGWWIPVLSLSWLVLWTNADRCRAHSAPFLGTLILTLVLKCKQMQLSQRAGAIKKEKHVLAYWSVPSGTRIKKLKIVSHSKICIALIWL